MNTAMIIELVIFAVLALGGLALSFYLRRKLEEYDGMGEVKKKTDRRKTPSDKTL